MGSLVSYAIPNLSQGISQQPDAQRDPTQGEVQVNGCSSLADGLRKREGCEVIAKVAATSFGDVHFHQILRDQNEKYLVVIGGSWIKVFDLQGTERAVAAPGGFGYLAPPTTTPGQPATFSGADIRAATVADFTFISNLRRVPAMAGDVAPAAARPAHEALVWVKAANYGQAYKVNVNGTEVKVETAVQAVVVTGSTTTQNRISTEEIAENIETGLAAVAGVTISRAGSVLHLTSSNPITVAATDARANADLTAITSSVQAFTELPTIAPAGYQIEVKGDPGNRFDGYFVQFVPRSGTFGEGAWEETVAPGVRYRLDPATMPHLLARLADGSFWFGPASGGTVGGTTIPAWGERTAGDYDTARTPSFVGYAIQDIFVYKNRLGILADETVTLSRARDFFSFFPETVVAVLDSDPIEITASNSKVSVLRYAVPYQDELIIFSDQIQFRFGASDVALTPETAQISVLTQYEIDINCRPLPAQGAIIFCQANGQWSQFREFSIRGAGTALMADAPDLNTHAPSYVPSPVTKLAGNDTGNVWFALSEKTRFSSRIYVHKYYYRNTGNGAERAQSSWSEWRLNGATQILSMLCVEETLYLLCEYGDGVWLESLSVSDRLSDPAPAPFPLLLDRRVSTTAATPAALRVPAGAYDPVSQETTWTLPYQIASRTEAWSGYSDKQNGGVYLGHANSGNIIKARGDWSGADVYFGEAFSFFYRFTRFKLYKEIGGGKVAASIERVQIRYAMLRYHETGFFRVRITNERRPTATYVFDGVQIHGRHSVLGNRLGTDNDLDQPRYSEGSFRIPVFGRGEGAVVEIENDTPHPCSFSSCEWVGLLVSQARSLR